MSVGVVMNMALLRLAVLAAALLLREEKTIPRT